DRDDAVDDAADARLERRDAGPPVPTVGHADHVGHQELLVPPDQEREVLGTRLLLALDQHLDRDRRLALPRPYRRPSRTSGSNGGLVHSSSGPSGWMSWCA